MYTPPHTPHLRATLARVPSGGAGVFHTLRLMRAMVERWKKEIGVINAAIAIVFLVPEKDELAEVDALFTYVRDSIRYTRDVNGIETIAEPLTTMERRVGDCDDKTLLFATLAESIGYPTRFVVAAYNGSPDYEHVYAQVLTSAGWLDADATEQLPLGAAPEGATRIHYER